MVQNDLEVVVQLADGAATLALRGDIDAYTGPSLTEYLDAAVAETDGNVTVNLANVAFVDSSGIAVLVGAAKRLRERGHELVVEEPAARVSKILEMTGVTKLLRVER
jgi:anti-sigma B factor antagonist